MLIDHILLTENNKFSFLGKSDENVEMISRQLTELKKHQVQLDTLKEVTKNTQDKYLQKKLEDITNLYDLYNNSISECMKIINHFTPLYLLLKKCYNKHQIESTPDNTMNKQVGLRLCLRERSHRL